ncbi:MAG: prepilin-type N-terminal cleavage/methylation domain-containing protein [Lachnospiraceae bacterium]|jgi:prepilin-type N-terminal cleavage/methylation domain-containing protein|nr:prepilin-type N-terminal cleavage/methylation domain-containing protein [Lachnospiraceae bacterium]
MKNKGFSLIELIVALAVGSIVLLMVGVMLVRGTSMFRTENDEVNMRNDYQIIRNQIDQVLMEAKMLTIEKQGNYLIIYTGQINPDTREFTTTSKTTERIITYDSNNDTLYISGTYADHVSEGNVISTMVEDFDISLDESSKRTVDGGGTEEIYYVNPLKINISLSIANKKSTVDYDYTLSLRNRLKGKDAEDKKIFFYETVSDEIELKEEFLVESYMVK